MGTPLRKRSFVRKTIVCHLTQNSATRYFYIELTLTYNQVIPIYTYGKEEITTNDYLKGIVLNLPDSPGIYQYLNSEGTIIYVGKAKNLKRRVSSYFNREHPNGKTRLLVSKISDIRYIVVKTEEDALLLENNLIKKYKPRYNVLLKDDKTYPSICVSNEYFPRIFKTRKIIRNGSSYYGPYSHMPSMLAVMDLIKSSIPSALANST